MRILLLDNDPDFLNTRAEFLDQAGYRVLKAYTLEEARQLLAEARIHLAILDIRIVDDDDDERDTSGLILAKDPAFRPIPKIMLTGFPSYQYVREALGPALDGLPPAVDFLSKQEGPEAMIQAVEQAFAQHVRINWDLRIRWDERERLSFPHLVTFIEPDLDTARPIGQVSWRTYSASCSTTSARSPSAGSCGTGKGESARRSSPTLRKESPNNVSSPAG